MQQTVNPEGSVKLLCFMRICSEGLLLSSLPAVLMESEPLSAEAIMVSRPWQRLVF